MTSRKKKPQLVISFHADTCFPSHRLRRQDGYYLGPLDNFVGVHAVMNAFLRGRMGSPGLRIELTNGEEKGRQSSARGVRPTYGTGTHEAAEG